ncbi:MAG: hypothetical protein AB7N65_23220 [Vicinamibacterales bacterium]
MLNFQRIPRLALALGLVAAMAAAATAQPRGGRGVGRYDPATETTITGPVTDIQTQQGPGRRAAVHLVVQSLSGPILVHVGPVDWLAAHGYAFAKGESVTVVGAMATVNDEPVMLARQITRGSSVMTLRNDAGIALWAKARGRRQS